MKSIKTFVTVLIAVFAIAACVPTDWVGDQIGKYKNMPVRGGEFNKALHSEYIAIAEKEKAAGRLSNAIWYAKRAGQAASGAQVQPLDPTVHGMPPARQAQAVEEHGRLQRMFLDGARENDPRGAARAQAEYDYRTREWCTPGMKGPAVAEAPPATNFILFFDFDRSNIRPDAARVLDQAASAAKSMGSKSVVIEGHTDTVGSSAYNQSLSIRRANAARRGMQQRGVQGNYVVRGRGETDLRVKTPDNVREQENRRAEIRLQ